MKLFRTAFIFWLASQWSTTAMAAPKASYGDALQAYEQYWQTFEKYDNRKIKQAQNKYQKRWLQLKDEYDKKLTAKSKEQFARLSESVKKYRLQLQEHPDSNNRPYVLLNLAQVYSIMATVEYTKGASSNAIYLDYALKIIEEIESTYPRFEYIENALYIKAVTLDQMQRSDEALKTWTKLSVLARNSKYGLYAIIGMGDYFFTKDIPNKALNYFRKAKRLLDTIKMDNKVYEALRVHYRLAWAAYRTADLEESIEAATGLLSLRYKVRNPEKQEKVFADAIELTGDALYEKNQISSTRRILKRKDLRAFADSIGDRILKRYDTNNIYSGTVDIGKFLLSEFPLSKHIPNWYVILGRSYGELKQEKNKVESLERLAMLLPKNSLWQNKYRNNFKLINDMKKKAEEAARFVAAFYYDYGIATGNPSKFLTAASYYKILALNLPDHKEANHWKLRQAHCYYFGDRLPRSVDQYNYLLSRVQLSPAQLEIALYQLSLATEKIWRRKFSEAASELSDVNHKTELDASLKSFAENTEKFANRFPDNVRSVDLLLLVASAYRDSDNYTEARSYWKRVLVSSPTVSQRLIAIRGLIYAEVHSGNDADVASLTERFLRLEDWNKVDPNFRKELLSILSSAVSQYSQKLNKEEKPSDAGKILIEQAKQFKNLPNREKMYRDGAYLLAIGDDWRGAGKATSEYLDAGLSLYRDDMLYLSARSYEFRLNFKMAAKNYIKLAEGYPKYKRSLPGLKRAERLAFSDKDWMTAAAAATLIAKLGPKVEAQKSIDRAVDYYNRAERYDLAKRASQMQMRVSSGRKGKLIAQLNYAKAKKLNGEDSTAAKELRKISSTLKKARLTSSAQYAKISGETHFLLGKDTEERFNDFKLNERSGTLTKNVAFKMKLLERMIKQFDTAIDSGDPEWSSRARYSMGMAAGEFADEIARTIVNKGERLGSRSINRLNKTSERLKQLHKSYHSQNVLARTKNPSLYKNNRWIEQSKAQLSSQPVSPSNVDRSDNLPIAIYSDMSNVWSH